MVAINIDHSFISRNPQTYTISKPTSVSQHLIQPIRLLQILNVEQSSTSLPRIYCNLSTQPCCYEFHCKYDTDSVLYHFLLGCTLTDLTSTDAVGLCADRGFANTLPDGVATRVCQSDGVWNGSST